MPTSSWCPRSATNSWLPVDLSVTSPTSPCLVADIADFLVSPTQTGLLLTCHGNFSSNHLDMSWWFETPKLSRNFPVTWSISATSPWQVADFPETFRWHVTGKFRVSRHNGTWAYSSTYPPCCSEFSWSLVFTVINVMIVITFASANPDVIFLTQLALLNRTGIAALRLPILYHFCAVITPSLLLLLSAVCNLSIVCLCCIPVCKYTRHTHTHS